MANNKTLELSIKISPVRWTKSLMAALNGSQSQISSFARSISSIGTAGLAAMGTLATATVATIASCTKEAAKFEKLHGGCGQVCGRSGRCYRKDQ